MKIKALDAIRAIAALYVFANHAYILQFGDRARGVWSDVLLYGHLSVTMFIVLSGFCLGLPLIKREPIAVGRWLQRRCQRIIPPYYGAIAVLCLIILLKSSLLGIEPPLTVNGILANLLMVGDLLPASANQISITFWSVSVEFKIYLLFPIMVWALYRYGMAAMLFVAALLATITALLIWLAGVPLDYPCPWYVFLFGLGLAAAQLLEQGKRAGVVALFALTTLVLLLYRYPYTANGAIELFKPHLLAIDLAAGCCFAALLVWLAGRDNNGWLNAQGFAWLAGWSYSLYLLHNALLKNVNILLAMAGFKGWGAISLATIPVLFSCWLFSQGFERPFLKSHVKAHE